MPWFIIDVFVFEYETKVERKWYVDVPSIEMHGKKLQFSRWF
jgi:hypothetical protein